MSLSSGRASTSTAMLFGSEGGRVGADMIGGVWMGAGACTGGSLDGDCTCPALGAAAVGIGTGFGVAGTAAG